MLLLLASLVMPMPTEYFCRYSMRNRASNNIWFVYHGFIVRIRSVRSCEPHWLGIGNQLNSWQNRFFSSNFPFFSIKIFHVHSGGYLGRLCVCDGGVLLNLYSIYLAFTVYLIWNMKGKWIKTDIRMLRCMIEYIYFSYVELNFWTEYACL